MPWLARSLALLVVAACMQAAPARAASGTVLTSARPDQSGALASPSGPLVVIFFENRSYDEIIGNPCCPFINAQASSGRLYDHYWAVGHLSLPNYLAFAGGSMCGKTPSDGVTPYCRQRNLWDQLHTAGIGWLVYQESMPIPCDESDVSRYVVRHNPEAVYADQVGTAMCATHDVALPDTITTLPPFTFVTPNLCNDMHSCSSTRGDTWLQTWMPRFLAVSGTRVIVTFDEGVATNHVVAFEVGAGVPNVVNHTQYSHYSLLAGIEVAFGRLRLGNAATAIRLPI